MNAEVKKLATDVLADLGFQPGDNGFEGQFELDGFGRFAVRIEVPSEFPARLPVISFRDDELGRAIAHVMEGKACIAHTSGVLLDRHNPEGILRESVARARKILRDGLSGESDPDLIAELLAYWNRRVEFHALSIVSPNAVPRRIVLAVVDDASQLPFGRPILFAESSTQAAKWFGRFGATARRSEPAFYLPLKQPFQPNSAVDVLSAGSFLKQLEVATGSATWQTFTQWLRTVLLPVDFLISLPAEHGRTVVAVGFSSPLANSKGGQYTFRPGQVRAAINITTSPKVARMSIDRFDTDFLLPRGGAEVQFSTKSCVVVGCGAVGSFLSDFLALIGVGALRLIDPEKLTNENIHRHLLGVADVDHFKAESVAKFLEAQLPHLSVEYVNGPVEDVIRDKEAFLFADLLINATGDETLGQVLNEALRAKMPVLHCWNDPMGLGGHVLLTFPGQPGCYECIFKLDSDTGAPYNAASFSDRDQDIARSFAGCAGVFVPFSVLDSVKTATECASTAASVLSGSRTEPTMISWFGDASSFLTNGFRLSPRAGLFRPGETKVESDFIRDTCEACGPKL
jgi:molybdopterin/thiamine biosynthesis adenylyltransferase